MTPYASFLYFGAALYALIPVAALGWLKKFSRCWLLLAGLGMLALQYWRGSSWNPAENEFSRLLLYAALQALNARVFLWLRPKTPSRLPFWLALLVSLAPLLTAKFFPGGPVGFVGLSYLTFRGLDVLFGIQDGAIRSLSLMEYGAFLLFFPTISSGPIDRFLRFEQDFRRERTRAEWFADLDGGLQHLFRGFLYKFILAALIKQYWLDTLPGAGGEQLLSYMYAYTFYLFFDFAGYSAFAIGFSSFFGIHPPENFARPFLARDLHDFWNRWHISLSFWFRDFVYSRFVFAAVKQKWFKGRFTAAYLGYFLSMGLMGVWHGLEPHYMVYGLYHGGLLFLTDWFKRRYRNNRLLNSESLAWRAAAILLTFHLVSFGFLIFSGRLFR